MLIHKASIYRHADVMEGNFTKKVPDQLVASNISCKFIKKTFTNSDDKGRVKITVYYKLLLPPKTDIRNGDMVVWSDDANAKYKAQEPFSASGKFINVLVMKEGEA